MRVTSSRELSGYVVHVNLNKAPEGNSIIVTLACKVYLLKGNEFGLGHWKKQLNIISTHTITIDQGMTVSCSFKSKDRIGARWG